MFKFIFLLIVFLSFLTAKSVNFSMVISGGISLGAYESGYNWAMINLLKKLPKYTDIEPKLSSSAGASAGAINTLLTAIYWCQKDNTLNSVDNNLFYNTWTKIDIDDLLIKGYDPNNSSTLFSRDILNQKADAILRHMQKPIFKKGCSIPLGFMVTKSTPITEKFKNIPIKIQSFNIALTLYEKNGQLYFKNRELPKPYKELLHQLYIPKIEEDRSYIKNILFASSAFPMAFSQVKLDYVYNGKRGSDWFLDGGLYNNIPLDLSLALSSDTNYFLFIDPDSKRSFNKENLKFCKSSKNQYQKAFIPKDIDEYKIAQNSTPNGFFETNLTPLIHSVSVFRSLKLYETINRYFRLNPDKKLILSSRYHPITGYFIGAFGAFLDKNFRDYDYYVGVYDAIYELSKKALERGFANKKDLYSQMLEYKKWLNLDNSKSAKEAFELLIQTEFCQRVPKENNRFVSIYNAFRVTQKYEDIYSIDAFNAFLKALNSKYLKLKPNSFLADALKNPDDWYKDISQDLVERVVVLENQKAKKDKSSDAIAKAVSFSAWLSSGYLAKREGLEFQPLLPEKVKLEKENLLYRFIPSEIALDTNNGGFSFAYSLYWYKKWAIFEGIEAKLSYNHSKNLDDHLRLDIDPFTKSKNSIYVGAGVSVFGNLEGKKFWDRKSAFGLNAYVDYNNIVRFTYIRRFKGANKNYFYFGIENLASLIYYINR